MSRASSDEARFDSYADFYRQTYGAHIASANIVGTVRASLIEARQGSGDWSDAPTPDLSVAWLASCSTDFVFDLGAGRFRGRQRPEDAILIAPGAGSTIEVAAAHTCCVLSLPYRSLLIFVGEDHSHRLPQDGDFGVLHSSLLRDKGIVQLLRTFRREANERAHGVLLIDGLILQLMGHLLRARDDRGRRREQVKGGLAAWQERRVAEYMAEHSSHDIAITTLATLTDLSTFHFARAFTRTFGLPPHAYLRQLRCKQAADLLVSSDLRIGQIAEVIGYETPQAFARMFRAEVGTSPGTYRRERRS